MKICHVCHTEFPSGLTCPSCGAFVVDPITDDETRPERVDDVPASGSLGGWVLPAATPTGHAGPEALGPSPAPDLAADGDAGGTPAGAAADEDPWSLPLPAPSSTWGADPPPRGTWGERTEAGWAQGATPDPEPDPDGRAAAPSDRDQHGGDRSVEREDEPANPAPVETPIPRPSALPANPDPGSLGGWIMPESAAPPAPSASAGESPEPSTERPSPPRADPSSAPSAGPATTSSASSRTTATPTAGWAPSSAGVPPADAGAAATAPGSSTIRRPKPATIVVIGVVAAFALVSALVLLLQPSGSSKTSDAVASDITGTCFVYNGAREKVERTVPCTTSHDGTVLAFVGDPSACPDTTTAILTGQTDSDGTRGVICVNETT